MQVAIVPPSLQHGEEPGYPDGASGDANVICELDVGVDGSVQDAQIVADPEASASASLALFQQRALETVRTYRFSPALREGKPARARVRVAVTFTAPTPVVDTPAATPTAKPEPEPVQEVRVRGERYELKTPTQYRLGRAEVRLLPGAFGDPFRAIEILPGVVPTISGLPYYYIRGAPPAATGYFVDEVRVPYLFHFGLGPSVIHPALMNEVSLHPAAYPARFGRFSGGIIAGETAEPSSTLRGEALVRLFDAGAYVEAPLAHGRAHVGLGGRIAYPGVVLSLVAPEITLYYQDYNARVSTQLGERTRLTAFVFGAFDYAFSTEDNKPEQVFFASEFHRLDVRLDHRTERTRSRVAVTLGLDRTRLEDVRFARDYITAVRGRHRILFSDAFELEAGADVFVDFYDGDLPSPYAVSRRDYLAQESLYSARTDTASGAWLSALLRPGLGIELTATARADLFTSADATAFGPSPRFSGRVPIHEKVAALFALGIANQPPRMRSRCRRWAIAACLAASPTRTRRARASRSSCPGISPRAPWAFTTRT